MLDKVLSRVIAESTEITGLRRRYIRDRKTGAPRALLISFWRDGKMYVGHAFCALEKKDLFKKSRAMFNCLENSLELKEEFERVFLKNVPQYAQSDTKTFWERNMAYLKKLQG